MIGFAVAQIFLRNFFGIGIIWADPLVRVLVLWAGLIGAMVAARLDQHIVISALAKLLPPRWKAASRLLTDGATAIVCLIVAVVSVRFVYSEYQAATVAFAAVPAWVCQLVIPVAFVMLACRYTLFAVERARQMFERHA
ncbi:MAG: TRAP transporter small permease [Pseudomonadota bacterium]|nr:MAG: TRAP transporter small permease [Pseudomonadota bacterium]